MENLSPPIPAEKKMGRGTLLFTAGLFVAGVASLVLTVVLYFRKAPSTPEADIAADATEYLRSQKREPLTDDLRKLIADPDTFLVKAQDYPFLGKQAPDFDLVDPQGQRHRLRDLTAKGPVVVIFYYGYYCNHCVSQLFDVNEDIRYFHELGAEVVAISADAPELTAQRFRKYGAFGYPVLSDRDNKVARSYGVYKAAHEKEEEVVLHGTFVIGRDGIIHWAQYGDTPFTGNRTLLYMLASLGDQLPAAKLPK